MGTWFSCCCNENKTQDDDPDVRTHLLNDPVCNSSSIPHAQSDDISCQYQNSLPKRADEQSVLNKILQETVQNVIDVAALGPHHIEQNEYLEKRNHYSSIINHLTFGNQPASKNNCILIDIATPEKILCSLPVSNSDYFMIKKASHDIMVALADLKVRHTEDLIVPFQIGVFD